MSHNEPTLIERLRELPPQRLLQMRAEGDELADDWHRAIEIIYAERREYLPPKPSQPVVIEPARSSVKGDALIAFGSLLVAVIIGKMLQESWLAWPVGLALLVFYLGKYIRRGWLSEEQRAEEVAVEQANAQGLNELMRCAADGHSLRVRELLDFAAADINSRCKIGATALIYAARNGHADIVDMLIGSGAHTHIVTNKGTSAAATARQFGHDAIADKLEQIG